MLKNAIRRQLVQAAQHNDTNTIYSILSLHPELINQSAITRLSFRDETPLAAAAMRGHMATIRLLLQLGANLDAFSGSYYGCCTAIIAAIHARQAAAVAVLYDAGANLAMMDSYNQSAVALGRQSSDNGIRAIFTSQATDRSGDRESKGAEP